MIHALVFMFCIGNMLGLIFFGIQLIIEGLAYALGILLLKFDMQITINYKFITLLAGFVTMILIYFNYLGQSPIEDSSLVINTYIYAVLVGAYIYHHDKK